MIDEVFFRSLGIIVIAAAVMVMLGRLIRMPAIVVYLMAGVLIGPVLRLVEMSEALELISEAGIALLLFLVGLELSFAKIRSVGKVALIAGTGQVLFTAIGGFLISKLLGYGNTEAAFIGAGITFSSTVIAVKLLDEKKELNTHYGHIAVACSLVQSFLVILLLSILTGLGGGEGSAASMAWGTAKAFGAILLMGGVVLLAARFLLPRPFAWAARSPDTALVWSLTWCFIMILLAEALGLSLEIGAFLAGISLAQLPHNEDLHRRVHPLMNLFMAIFFVSLAIPMTFDNLDTGWLEPLVLSLFVIIGNTVFYMVMIPRFGFSARTGLLTGITGAQISEFSFILAAMGLASGMIGIEIVGLMTFIGLLTMGVSAYLIRYNQAVANALESAGVLKWFNRGGTVDPEVPTTALSGHVIVVGMNTLGRRLALELAARGETVLAIDTDPLKLEGLVDADGSPIMSLVGSVDYLSLLEEAALHQAKLLVTALRIEETNDLLAYRCRMAGIPCAAHVIDLSVVDNLMDLEVAYLMISKVDGVKAQAVKLREMGLLK
jgi:Kef-type K+ transport system membrane component KefB